jgi:anti-anti-sigma factor
MRFGTRTEDAAEMPCPSRPEVGAPFAARLVRTAEEVSVAIDGEIDLATSAAVWAAMAQAMALGPRLILDLGGTTFIDATGIALLVRAYHQLGRRADAIVVRSLRPQAGRIFSITGIDRMVTIEDSPRPRPDSFRRRGRQAHVPRSS